MRLIYRYIILFFIICSYLLTSCNHKHIDNNPIPTQKSIKDSITEIFTLTKNKKYQKTQKIRLLENALLLAQQNQLDTLIIKSLNKLSIVNYTAKNYQESKKYSDELLLLAKKLEYLKYAGRASFYLGSYYSKTNTPDSAFYYFNQAKLIYIQSSDSIRVARSLLNMAIIQNDSGDFLGAELTAGNAFDFLKNNPKKSVELSIYNTLGIATYQLQQYTEAIYWYKQALKLSDSAKEKAIIFNNIGITYRDIQDYNTANFHFKKAIEIIPKNDKAVKAMILDNIGYLEAKSGNNSGLQKMITAKKIRTEIKNYSGIVISDLHLGDYYIYTKKDTIIGFDYLNKSLTLAKKIKDQKSILKGLKILSDHSKNRTFQNKYNNLLDSVTKAERNHKFSFAAIQLKTKQKQNQLDQLQKDYNYQKDDLSYQKKSKWWILTLLGVSLVLLSVISFSLYQRKKIHRQQIIIEKYNAKEQERQTLSMHVHDQIAGDILLGLQSAEKLKSHISHPLFIKTLSFFERAYKQSKDISQDLSQVLFDKIPFDKKIKNLTLEYALEGQIDIRVTHLETIAWKKVLRHIKATLYIILKESLTNIIKHANADKVTINFKLDNNHINMIIQDNGVGFSYHKQNKGLGIENMKKRVYDVQGKINFVTNNEIGTIIHVQIPYLTK